MSKDNLMMVVAIVAGMIGCVLSRHNDKQIEKDWKVYVAHDYDDEYKSKAR